MPYIEHKTRIFLNNYVEDIKEAIRAADGEDVPTTGTVNYVITSIVASVMKPPSGWTYGSLSKALAVFRDAEAEMRRRLLDPYEDKAILRNGDLTEYVQ